MSVIKGTRILQTSQTTHPASQRHSPEDYRYHVETHGVTYRVEEVASNKHHVQHFLEWLVCHQICNTHNGALQSSWADLSPTLHTTTYRSRHSILRTVLTGNHQRAHLLHILSCYSHNTIYSCTDVLTNVAKTTCHNSQPDYLLTYLRTYLLTHALTHSLNPRSIVLLEKLTGSQLVKKIPAFYGIRRFITACTSEHHLPLFQAKPIQFMPPTLFLKIHHNIILSSPPYMLHAPPISFISI